MKKLLAFFLLLMLFGLFGCSQKSVSKPTAPAVVPIDYLSYSDENISFKYPAWSDSQKQPGMFMAKLGRGCMFAAASYPVPPAFYLKILGTVAQNISVNGEYVDYIVSGNGQQFKGKSRVIYCNYNTYVVSMGCALSEPYTESLDSVSCLKRELKTMPKLGLIPNPANDNVSLFPATAKEMRAAGVDVFYWNFAWADLANDWAVSDYLMTPAAYEGRTAVTAEVIHTNGLSRYPANFTSFDQPGFKEAYVDFAAAFVKRYHPDYFFVGNEVDDYLYLHREQIPAFKELLRATRERIKQENPATKVGFTTTYHDAKKHNATDIIVTLSEDADLIGYTAYGYHDTFVFDNVSLGLQYLDDVKNVVPGKPYAIVEAGWSTSPMLNSSEDKQAEFAQGFFSRLGTTNAEFVTWVNLHDGTDCTATADSFLTGSPDVKDNAELMAAFKEFLCNFGLKKSDGSPKEAWAVWEEKIK